ncbi:hypothetical protein P355_0717 [Burkholderia cenocepacia KC-01]|nr:hypothetical protein P355_0717 [Burkholderia cenocepacia KC-01]
MSDGRAGAWRRPCAGSIQAGRERSDRRTTADRAAFAARRHFGRRTVIPPRRVP